jgi:hypothetical protein
LFRFDAHGEFFHFTKQSGRYPTGFQVLTGKMHMRDHYHIGKIAEELIPPACIIGFIK